MSRTTETVGTPGFILGVNYDANDGRQVDFDRVPASFENADGNKEVPGATVVSELGSGKVIPRSATKGTISNLDETGETATATENGHDREVGDEVTIEGANTDAYNGTWTITSVSENSWDFEIGETVAEDTDGGTVYMKASAILLATALEGDNIAAKSGYGVVLGGVVFKNLLAQSDHSDFDTWLSELKEAGTGFVFEEYSDDRSS